MADDIVSIITVMCRNLASPELAKVGESARAAAAAADEASAGGIAAFAGGIAKLGIGAVATGVAIAGVSMKLANDFNNSTLMVGNNTGMTNARLAELRANVLKLGADSPAPLADIAQGFEKAANAGIYGSKAFYLVKEGMMAAVEHGGTVVDAVNSVTGALKEFNQPASEAGKAFGILAMAAAEGDLRFPDLVNNFSKVGTSAGAMHQPLSQAAAALATLTRFNHNAALSQTELYGMLQHIQDITGPTAKEITALSQASGVDLANAFKKVNDGSITLTQFMGIVRDSLHKAGLSAGDANAALQKLFGGTRGGLAALTLMNQGWKDYNQIAHSAAASTDLIGRQWGRTASTFSSQAGELKNKIIELGIAFGEPLLQGATGAMTQLNRFGTFLLQHKAEVSAFGQAVAHGVGDALSAIGKGLQAAWPTIQRVLGAMKQGFSDLANLLLGIKQPVMEASAGWHSLADQFDHVTGPTRELTTQMQRQGGAVQDALGKLGQFKDALFGTDTKTTTLHGHVAMLADDFTHTKGTVDTLTSTIQHHAGFLDQLGATLDRVSQHGKSFRQDLDAIEQAFERLQTAFGHIGYAFDIFSSKSRDAGAETNTLARIISGVLMGALDLVTGEVTAWVDVFVTGLDFVVNVIHTVIQLVGDIAQVLHDTGTIIYDVWHGNWSKLLGDVRGFVTDTGKIFTDLVSNIIKTFTGLFTDVTRIISDGCQSIIKIFTDLADVLVGHSIVPDMVDAIVACVATLPGRMLGALGSLLASVTAPFRNLASSSLSIVTGMVSSVVSAISPLVGDLTSRATSAASGFISALRGGLSSAGSVMQGAVNAIVSVAQGLAGALASAASAAASAFVGALSSGLSAVGGVIGGALGAVSSAAGAIGNIIHGHAAYPTSSGSSPYDKRTYVSDGVRHSTALGVHAQSGNAVALVSQYLNGQQTLNNQFIAARRAEDNRYNAAVTAENARHRAALQTVNNLEHQGHLQAAQRVLAQETAEHSRNLSQLSQVHQGFLSTFKANLQNGAIQLEQALTKGLGNQGTGAGHDAMADAAAKVVQPMLNLTNAMGLLPPQFQAAGNAVVSKYQTQVTAAYDAYLSKLKAENDKYNASVSAEHTKVNQAIANENTRHEQAVANIRNRANQQENNYLINHSIRVDAANQRALQQGEKQEAAYQTRRQNLENQMLAAHTQAQKAHIAQEIAALDVQHKKNLANTAAMLGIKNKEQQQQLNQYLTNHAQVLNQALTQEDQHHQNTLNKLGQGEATYLAKLQAAHNAHVKALTAAFDASAKKIGTAIAAATSPSGILTGVQNVINTGLKNATDQLILDFLETGKAAQADIAAYQKAAAQQATLTAAQQQAAQTEALATGDFKTALASLQQSIQGPLDQALAKYTLDLATHTGNLEQDALSLQQAQQALDSYNATVKQAQDVATQQQMADALAAGDFKTAMDSVSSTLQGSVDQALAKYAYDVMNNSGDLAADSKAIQDATAKQKQYTDAVAQAQAVTTQAAAATAQSFSQLQSAAQGQASQALDALALAIQTGNGDVGALASAAKAAAANAQSFADAMTQATAMVQANTAATTGQYDATIQAAQANYNDALAAYENADIAGVSGQALIALYNAAVLAGVQLQSLQNIAQAVTTAVNGIINPTQSSTSSPVTTPPTDTGVTPIPVIDSGTTQPLQTIADNTTTSVDLQQQQLDALQAANTLLQQQNAQLQAENTTLAGLLQTLITQNEEGLAQSKQQGSIGNNAGIASLYQRIDQLRAANPA